MKYRDLNDFLFNLKTAIFNAIEFDENSLLSFKRFLLTDPSATNEIKKEKEKEKEKEKLIKQLNIILEECKQNYSRTINFFKSPFELKITHKGKEKEIKLSLLESDNLLKIVLSVMYFEEALKHIPLEELRKDSVKKKINENVDYFLSPIFSDFLRESHELVHQGIYAVISGKISENYDIFKDTVVTVYAIFGFIFFMMGTALLYMLLNGKFQTEEMVGVSLMENFLQPNAILNSSFEDDFFCGNGEVFFSATDSIHLQADDYLKKIFPIIKKLKWNKKIDLSAVSCGDAGIIKSVFSLLSHVFGGDDEFCFDVSDRRFFYKYYRLPITITLATVATTSLVLTTICLVYYLTVYVQNRRLERDNSLTKAEKIEANRQIDITEKVPVNFSKILDNFIEDSITVPSEVKINIFYKSPLPNDPMQKSLCAAPPS